MVAELAPQPRLVACRSAFWYGEANRRRIRPRGRYGTTGCVVRSAQSSSPFPDLSLCGLSQRAYGQQNSPRPAPVKAQRRAQGLRSALGGLRMAERTKRLLETEQAPLGLMGLITAISGPRLDPSLMQLPALRRVWIHSSWRQLAIEESCPEAPPTSSNIMRLVKAISIMYA
jgi:hypothetical protein